MGDGEGGASVVLFAGVGMSECRVEERRCGRWERVSWGRPGMDGLGWKRKRRPWKCGGSKPGGGEAG